LKRLGIPLADNIVKSKDFNAATKVLAETFGGAAKVNAETFSGRLAIMKQHLDESKEQIGYALMPVLTTFADYLVTNVVPNVQGFVDGLTGVQGSGDKATKSAHDFGEQVRGVIDYIAENQKTVENFAKVIGSIFIAAKIGAGVNAIIAGLTLMRGAFIKTTAVAAITAEAEAAATGGVSLLAALPAMAAIAAFFGVASLAFGNSTGTGEGRGAFPKGEGSGGTPYPGTTPGPAPFGNPYGPDTGGKWPSRAVGGSVMGGTSYYVGENGPEVFTPFGAGRITPNGLGGGSGMTVVVNVAGSVVHEKDLAVTVRDNIAQLMRRRGLNPSILGV
jgi:hypothetical protein